MDTIRLSFDSAHAKRDRRATPLHRGDLPPDGHAADHVPPQGDLRGLHVLSHTSTVTREPMARGYRRLDQAPRLPADIHKGVEQRPRRPGCPRDYRSAAQYTSYGSGEWRAARARVGRACTPISGGA